MLRENWRFVSRVERIGDAFIIILAFVAAYYGRSSLLFWNDYFDFKIPFAGQNLAPIKDYFIVLAVALTGYIVSLEAMGAYGSMRLSNFWRLIQISITSSVINFFLLAAVLFLIKIDLSRSFMGLFCILVAALLTLERTIVLDLLRYWRRRGRNFRNILICGIGEQALRLTKEIVARPELGIGIRGFADLREESDVSPEIRQKFLSDLRSRIGVQAEKIILGVPQIEAKFTTSAIDEIIFTDVVDVMAMVEEMVLICSERGVRTTLAADLFSLGMVKSGLSYFGGMPLIHFQTPPGDRWELGVKRCVDVVVSLLLLLIFAPFFLISAIAVRFSSSGPILFKQKRVGLNGRLFSLYKFRSMYAGAEEMLSSLDLKNEMTGPAFKVTNDPRVTKAGCFLRRFSLDELPQLWNVFRGDMSLVGPRPPVPGEVGLYERRERRRLSMRPGLTCTWQVSGRNDIKDFREWVKLDLEYIDNWSLSRDFILLFRTIPAVLFGTGAK